MPFVTEDHRKNPDENIPGDRCFIMYREMKDRWNKNRRWATVDEIYRWVTDLNQPNLDWQMAKELAWQIFFQLHVMPYEFDKRKINGDI